MLNKAALAECEKHQAAGKTVKVIAYGNKVRTFLGKRGWDIIGGAEHLDPSEYSTHADALATRLVDALQWSFARHVLSDPLSAPRARDRALYEADFCE